MKGKYIDRMARYEFAEVMKRSGHLVMKRMPVLLDKPKIPRAIFSAIVYLRETKDWRICNARNSESPKVLNFGRGVRVVFISLKAARVVHVHLTRSGKTMLILRYLLWRPGESEFVLP
jgi:hypothetical protein